MNTIKIISTQRVVIKEVATSVIKVCAPAAPSVIKVATAGPQGPKGDPGQNFSAYVHTQVTPASTWTVNHNLGFRPSVELLNSGGQEIEGDVIHSSVNQFIVLFNTAIAGTARLV